MRTTGRVCRTNDPRERAGLLESLPGKVNPTQCEALCNGRGSGDGHDVAVGVGGAGGYLEMNVYKPLMDIFNITHSSHDHDRPHASLQEVFDRRNKTQPEEDQRVRRAIADAGHGSSLVIATTRASKIAHYAMDNDLTLKTAALKS